MILSFEVFHQQQLKYVHLLRQYGAFVWLKVEIEWSALLKEKRFIDSSEAWGLTQ